MEVGLNQLHDFTAVNSKTVLADNLWIIKFLIIIIDETFTLCITKWLFWVILHFKHRLTHTVDSKY